MLIMGYNTQCACTFALLKLSYQLGVSSGLSFELMLMCNKRQQLIAEFVEHINYYANLPLGLQ